MKSRSLILLLALISPLAAQTTDGSGTATTPAASETSGAELLPNQQAFLNLPEEQRKEFGKLLGEGTRLFQQKRIFETLDQVDKAFAIFKDSPELYNLRGSCYVEMRAFDKALADFQKAAEFSKDNPSIDFNIAEVYFVTKKWQDALDIFDKILAGIPKENTALSRLVEFKMLLCKKSLGRKEEAAALANKYDYLDDSPYHYYANAALAYADEDTLKAEEWLARANRIFKDPNILAPWQDTLVEFGYIKSFYGSDDAADE
jgi:tetratricopeptide (TPR) repeat protein